MDEHVAKSITAKRVAKVISGGIVRRRIEEVLFEKRLNKAALMRGPKLLDEASLLVRQNAAKYPELDILVRGRHITCGGVH